MSRSDQQADQAGQAEPVADPSHWCYRAAGRFGEDWECHECWCDIGRDHDDFGVVQ